MKDREQTLGIGAKSLRGLTVAGLLLLSGCGLPPEKQVKKIDLGRVEITQLSPHTYKVNIDSIWNEDQKIGRDRAIKFLEATCDIELIRENIIIVNEPNCVAALNN